MKTQIRLHTFETNSSSMHSLQVLPEEKGYIKDLDEALKEDSRMKFADGKIIIEDTDDLSFEWGFDVLDTFYRKLCYSIASFCDYDKETDQIINLGMILSAVQTVMPEVKEIVFPVCEWRGDNSPFTGSIDHESYGLLNSRFDSVGAITDFIFNKENYAIIDNDNDPHTSQVVEAGCKTLKELRNFLVTDFDMEKDYEDSYDWFDEPDEEL